MDKANNQTSSEPSTVLIVDDKKSILTFVSTVIRRGGYQVLTAMSGEDALRQSREFEGPIHLLLANVQMPGITGIELGTAINIERPDTRVMLMSGFTSGMLMLDETWHFLHKPFLPNQLLQLVSTILKVQRPELSPDLDERNSHQLRQQAS